jgi:hypothetical protein
VCQSAAPGSNIPLSEEATHVNLYLAYTDANGKMIHEMETIRKEVVLASSKHRVLALAGRELRKPQKSSVMTIGIEAEF